MGVVRVTFDWLEGFVASFTPVLNDVVIFFLILFIGFLIGKIVSRLTRKLLRDVEADAFVKRTLNARFKITKIVGAIVAGLIYIVTVIIALNAVGLTTVALEIILAILVLALVVSALIALKDFFPNAAAGFASRKRLVPGRRVRVDNAEGTVSEVSLLSTTIETKNGDTIVIPNALFQKRSLTILPGKKKRVVRSKKK